MRIFVNCFGNTHMVTTDSSTLVSEVMRDIQNDMSLPLSAFLTSAEGVLPEEAMISEVVSENGNVSVGISLEGGKKGKSKKRKAYNTPKKNKHKKVNVKKAILNYYAIETDGSVKRVKRPSEQVGCKNRGVFMASHWNRYYCGFSHLTLIKKDAPLEEPKRAKKVAKVEPAKKGKK